MSREDLVGKKFSRLLVVSFSHSCKGRNSYWHCVCDCGKETVVMGGSLKFSATKSCGCLNSEIVILRNTKHSMSKSSTYISWRNLKARCLNPKAINYKDYGGRGIKVCKRWDKFENFFTDMGEKPEGLTLDRINNDGDYEPGNCRCATLEVQSNNKRSNRMITVDGETHNRTQWEKIKGLRRGRILSRINRGWSERDAVMTKVRVHSK